MELYYIIAITDHDRGEAMGSLYHAAGLHLILSMPARGTATSEHLAIYGLTRRKSALSPPSAARRRRIRLSVPPSASSLSTFRATASC